MQRRRHAVELGGTAERGDLGDDARQMIDRDRDLAGEIPPRKVVDLRQVLLEVAHVEPQPGQGILHLVGDLRRHAPERRDGAALEALEVVRVPNGDRRLRREQREELEIVLARLEPRRGLDHQRAGGAALDDERRGHDRAAVGALGRARHGDRHALVHRRRRRGLEASPDGRRGARARHGDQATLLELEHHAAVRVGRFHGGLRDRVEHAGHHAGRGERLPDGQEPLAVARPAARRQSARDLRAQLVAHEGLGEVVERAAADRLDGRLDRAVRRHDQHGQARLPFVEPFHEAHAVGGLHAQIEQGEVEAARLGRFEGAARIARGGHVEAHRGEPHLEHLEDRRVVVDHEDLLFHAAITSVSRAASRSA